MPTEKRATAGVLSNRSSIKGNGVVIVMCEIDRNAYNEVRKLLGTGDDDVPVDTGPPEAMVAYQW